MNRDRGRQDRGRRDRRGRQADLPGRFPIITNEFRKIQGISFASDYSVKLAAIDAALKTALTKDNEDHGSLLSETNLDSTRDILARSMARLPFWWSTVTDDSGNPIPTIINYNTGAPETVAATPISRVLGFITRPGNVHILILKAATGSGKSTMIPTSYILNSPRDPTDGSAKVARRMYVTQPRRLNAVTISRTVAQMTSNYDKNTLNPKVIGYMTGEKKVNENAGVLFVTEGLLAHLIRANPKKYIGDDSIIVIDEVHERNIETDQLIYEIFHYLEQCKINNEPPGNFRIIIMSATFEPLDFERYFMADIPNHGPLLNRDNIVSLQVAGTAAKIHVRFAPMPVPDVALEAATRIAKIHQRDKGRLMPSSDTKIFRDIIVFVPGERISRAVKQYLARMIPLMSTAGTFEPHHKNNIEKALIIDVNSNMVDTTMTNRSLTSFGDGSARRRIFLATDFAETGVTFEQLKFVVDLGLRNSVTFDPLNGINVMALVPVSKNSAIQRRGRVGRLAEGYCYHLYTEKDFNSMKRDTPPKILTDSRVTEMCMTFIEDGHIPSSRHLLTSITPEQEIYSLGLLWTLGMIKLIKPADEDGPLALLDRPIATQLGSDYTNIIRVGPPEFGKCVLAALALDPSIVWPMIVSLTMYSRKGKDIFPAVVPLEPEDPETSRLLRSDFLNYYEFYRQYTKLLKGPAQERRDWEREIARIGVSSVTHFTFPTKDVMEAIDTDLAKMWEMITDTFDGLTKHRGPLTHEQQIAFVRSIISGFHFNRAKLLRGRNFYECNSRKNIDGQGIIMRAVSIYANNGFQNPHPRQTHRAETIMFANLEWLPHHEYPVATGITVLDKVAVLPREQKK